MRRRKFFLGWSARRGARPLGRGFTLIELLVSVSIFLLITLVILANHSRFNSSVLLGALAYDIGLSVREAQVFGVSVRGFSGDFQVGYGVHFSSPSEYVFFVDLNGNQRFDEDTDTAVRTYTLGRGHRIDHWCGIRTNGTKECSNGTDPIRHIDILFERPNPDARISSNRSGLYSFAQIVVSSPAGETRMVEIASTGQISVKNPR